MEQVDPKPIGIAEVFSVIAVIFTLLSYIHTLNRSYLFDRPYLKIEFKDDLGSKIEVKDEQGNNMVAIKLFFKNVGTLPAKIKEISDIKMIFDESIMNGSSSSQHGNNIIYPNEESLIRLALSAVNSKDILSIVQSNKLKYLEFKATYYSLGDDRELKEYVYKSKLDLFAKSFIAVEAN